MCTFSVTYINILICTDLFTYSESAQKYSCFLHICFDKHFNSALLSRTCRILSIVISDDCC